MQHTTLDTLLASIKTAGIGQWEILFDRSTSSSVRFEYDRLKELGCRESSGYGLRIIQDGRLGFAATTNPDRLDDLPQQALASAAFGERAGFTFQASDAYPTVAIAHDSVASFTQEHGIERGSTLIETLKQGIPGGQAGAGFHTVHATRQLLNSAGLDLCFNQTVMSVSMGGILIDGESILGIHEGHSSCRDDADIAAMAETIIERFRSCRQTIPLRTGRYPVLFTPKVLPALTAAFKMGCNGRTVQKGSSPLTQRLGERIADPRVTFSDDPLLDYFPASRPADDEGIPSRKNVIINHGRLERFLFDMQTASRLKQQTTASAGRGFASPPAPSFSTLVMEPGDKPLSEIIQSIDEGILVDQALGGGQSNLLMGEFALNIELGFKIEKGEIVGRIKDTMVSGNVYEAFNAIQAISRERRFQGGQYLPSILFAELAIASKS